MRCRKLNVGMKSKVKLRPHLYSKNRTKKVGSNVSKIGIRSRRKCAMGEFQDYVAMLGTKDGWASAYPVLDRAGKAAILDIVDGLDHPNADIRKWCTALLDHHADERCIEPLIRRLTDAYADVRRHAVHSIGCQPCKAESLGIDTVSLLIDRALHDSSLRVRRSAVHMLGNQPYDARAFEVLQNIVEQETDRKLLFNASWSLKQQTAASRLNKEAFGCSGEGSCPPSIA